MEALQEEPGRPMRSRPKTAQERLILIDVYVHARTLARQYSTVEKV